MAGCGFDVQESFCRQLGRSGEDPSAYCQGGLGCGPVSLPPPMQKYICLLVERKDDTDLITNIAHVSIGQECPEQQCTILLSTEDLQLCSFFTSLPRAETSSSSPSPNPGSAS